MYIFDKFFWGILHLFKFFILSEMFFAFSRKKISKRSILAAIVIVFLTVSALFLPTFLFSFFIYGAAVSGLFLLIYQEKKRVLVCAGIGSVIVVSLLDKMTYAIIDIFIENETAGDLSVDFGANIVTILFLLLTGGCLKKAGKGKIKNVGAPYMLLFSFLLAADTYLLDSLEKFAVSGEILEQNPDLRITYIIVGIGMFLQILLVLLLIVSRNDFRERERMTKKYLENQLEYYRYLEQREAETKMFRHDLRSHLFALQSYMQKKQYAEMEQHLNQMYGTVEQFEKEICVNNNIVDAILNKYYTECTRQGIEFFVKGHFPMECGIAVYDLCTIFSNLLSNAQEAASRGEKHQILVNIRYTMEELIFHIENDYAGDIITENGKIYTKKCEKSMHGLGLENVRACVEKNHGCMSIQTDNQRFVVKVILARKNYYVEGSEGEFSSSCNDREEYESSIN